MKSKYDFYQKSDLKNLIELYLILFPAVVTRELITLRKQSSMKFYIMYFNADSLLNIQNQYHNALVRLWSSKVYCFQIWFD